MSAARAANRPAARLSSRRVFEGGQSVQLEWRNRAGAREATHAAKPPLRSFTMSGPTVPFSCQSTVLAVGAAKRGLGVESRPSQPLSLQGIRDSSYERPRTAKRGRK